MGLGRSWDIESVVGGARNDDAKELLILNRRVFWRESGIGYHIDPKHAKSLIEERLGQGAWPVKAPGVVDSVGDRTVAEYRHDQHVRSGEVEVGDAWAGWATRCQAPA